MRQGDALFAEYGLAPLRQAWLFHREGVECGSVCVALREADAMISSTGEVEWTRVRQYLEQHGYEESSSQRWTRKQGCVHCGVVVLFREFLIDAYRAPPLIQRDLVHVWEYHSGLREGVLRCFRAAWMLYVEALQGEEQAGMRKLFLKYLDDSANGDVGHIEENHVSASKRFYVAVYEGRVIGHCAVHVNGNVATMFRVATCPEAQGYGIASLLLNRSEEFACVMLCNKVDLTTGAMMHLANRFYVAKGFTLIKSEPHESGAFVVNTYERPIAVERMLKWGANCISLDEQNRPLNAEGTLLTGDVQVPAYQQELYRVMREWDPQKHRIEVVAFSSEYQLPMEHCYRAARHTKFAYLEQDNGFYANLELEFVRDVLSKDMSDPVTHYRGKGGEMYLAVVGKYVYGCVAVRKDGELVRLAVHPAARNRGIGRMLCSRVEEHCRAAKLPKVFLTTGGWMVRARSSPFPSPLTTHLPRRKPLPSMTNLDTRGAN